LLTVNLDGIFSPSASKSNTAKTSQGCRNLHESLCGGTGRGRRISGLAAPSARLRQGRLSRIGLAASKIRSDSSALVVIGSRVVPRRAPPAIEYLRSPNYNLLKKDSPTSISPETV
jgi:glucose-6-phosphate isomerase